MEYTRVVQLKFDVAVSKSNENDISNLMDAIEEVIENYNTIHGNNAQFLCVGTDLGDVAYDMDEINQKAFRIKIDMEETPEDLVRKLRMFADGIQEAIEGEHTNATLDGVRWGEDGDECTINTIEL